MIQTSQPLLIELFTEELPPKALPKLEQAFAQGVCDALQAQGLLATANTVTAFASPRRLAVRLSQVLALAPEQPFAEKLMPVKVGLDAQGQALMFHATPLMRRLGDVLPPAIVIEGAATYREKMALPRGVELRVQLLDVTKAPPGSSGGEVLAEQVVRSGWHVPIPFALRLPRETSFEGRKLAIAARLVLAHQALFELRQPLPVVGTDFLKPIELVLEKAAAAGR